MDTPTPEAAATATSSYRWRDADAYLFDIDGTLLNTRDFVHWNALNRAMYEIYGVDTTIEGVAYHGKTDLGILRAALERAGIAGKAFEQRLPEALEVICREVSLHSHEFNAELCPGVPEILEQLQKSGKLLAVASGNLASVGWQKIEAAGLRHFFAFGCYSDHEEMRGDIFRSAVLEVEKHLPGKAEVCFIGDTPEDIKAARTAGGRVVAVGTGIFAVHDLQPYFPDLCISCCSDLLLL